MLLNYICWQYTAYARTQWHRVMFFVCLLKWDNSFKCLWLHWSNLFSNLRRHMTNILFFQLVGHTIVSNSFMNHESIWEKIKAIHTYLAYFFFKISMIISWNVPLKMVAVGFYFINQYIEIEIEIFFVFHSNNVISVWIYEFVFRAKNIPNKRSNILFCFIFRIFNRNSISIYICILWENQKHSKKLARFAKTFWQTELVWLCVQICYQIKWQKEFIKFAWMLALFLWLFLSHKLDRNR